MFPQSFMPMERGFGAGSSLVKFLAACAPQAKNGPGRRRQPFAAGVAGTGRFREEEDRMTTQLPNILFVFADQMRAHEMRCAGNQQIRTPAMDRLAAEGVLVSNCIATNPVCCPNRATMLTGTYATTHRVVANDLAIRTDLPSLGTVAAENGYRTGYVGKWHLDGLPRSKFTPPGPRRLGFEFWAAYNCTHDYFRPKWYRDTPELIEKPGYEPELQTDLVLEFLERKSEKPFLCVLSWGPPHDPYPMVPERYRALYNPDSLQLRPNVREKTDNRLARGLECRRTTADYYAAITALDEQLGRLLEWLDLRGLTQDTLVIFTSDHGDMLWSHGLMKKQSPYEESIAVPFLARWPRMLPAGANSGALLSSVDLLSTIAGLCGWRRRPRTEGRDLSAALRGLPRASTPESALIANYVVADEATFQQMPEWRGVRTRQHTYVELPGRKPWLLFDNRADPYQMRNLVGTAPALEDRLRRQLTGWLERTRDPFGTGEEFLQRTGLADAWAERQRNYGR